MLYTSPWSRFETDDNVHLTYDADDLDTWKLKFHAWNSSSRLWAFQGKEEECGLIFTLILMNLKLWNNIFNYNGFSLSKTCDTKFI